MATAFTLLSLVLSAWDSGVAVALFALVLLGQVVLRLAPLPAAVQAALAVTLPVAAWAALVEAYQQIPWLDLVVHAVANGLLALVAAALVIRAGWLRPGNSGRTAVAGGVILLTTALGVTLGVLWEFGEWFGHIVLDPAIAVGYDDTLGDLAAGGAGSLVAGATQARALAPRSPAPPESAS